MSNSVWGYTKRPNNWEKELNKFYCAQDKECELEAATVTPINRGTELSKVEPINVGNPGSKNTEPNTGATISTNPSAGANPGKREPNTGSSISTRYPRKMEVEFDSSFSH